MAGPVGLGEHGPVQSDRFIQGVFLEIFPSFIDLIPPKPVLRLRRLLHARKSSGGILRSQAERERGPIVLLVMARFRL